MPLAEDFTVALQRTMSSYGEVAREPGGSAAIHASLEVQDVTQDTEVVRSAIEALVSGQFREGETLDNVSNGHRFVWSVYVHKGTQKCKLTVRLTTQNLLQASVGLPPD